MEECRPMDGVYLQNHIKLPDLRQRLVEMWLVGILLNKLPEVILPIVKPEDIYQSQFQSIVDLSWNKILE